MLLFERAQTQLKGYMSIVDGRVSSAGSGVALSRVGFQWDAAFEGWMAGYLGKRGRETWIWVRDMMGEVQREINGMLKRTEPKKNRLLQHQLFLDKFKKSAYGKQAHYTIQWRA